MIGIISDTHENVESTKRAIKIFKEKNVEFVIHLGDIISPPTLLLFVGLKCYFVKGNNDGEVNGLKAKAKNIDAQFEENTLYKNHKGKTIAATHYPDIAKKLAQENKYDYIFHGHDHTIRDERIGKSRIINPGGHYNTDGKVALLDLEKDELIFI